MREQDDSVSGERTQRILDRFDRIPLSGISGYRQASVVQLLQRLTLNSIGRLDRVVSIRQPELQRPLVQCRRHHHDLRFFRLQVDTERVAQLRGTNRLTGEHQDVHT